jgi:glucose/arabinose dehydrogenase/PKD repeat protein
VPGSPADLARFEDTVVFSGLEQPTAYAFAPDGRVFVAEQSGIIKVFDDIDAATPTVFADLRTEVHGFWDRGLVGLALDPQFPTRPYVYVAYTYDAPIGGTAPTWGTAGTSSDPCPTPPGPTADGCVVSGRVSRLTASGNTATSEHVLINDWCQQYPSHTLGTVRFGPDGYLYLSGGEGASFGPVADHGQNGNPCGDPVLEGGALRAQDLHTPDDPTGLSGSVVRVDPDSGAAAPGNPRLGDPDPNGQRIIAHGLRNPFRFTFRPGTRELWVGDVGAGLWEEIDRIPDVADGAVENFGWPCYEGPVIHKLYDDADLPICEALYTEPDATTGAYASYLHPLTSQVPGCETGGAAISGLAFYTGNRYPPGYTGALFAADYARQCIWMYLAGADGLPDPDTARLFAHADSPMSLEIGPDGTLYYLSYWTGTLHHFEYVTNRTPIAAIAADPQSGPSPLTVTFDARGSRDPDPSEVLSYEWDLDGDGAFDDATAPTATWTYPTGGIYAASLRVTDRIGATDVDTRTITVDNSVPDVTIDTPAPDLRWAVGDRITFSAHATDAQDGALPAAAFSWSLRIAHCTTAGCHGHGLGTFANTASGSFVAPDHEYPSHLELTVTATDSSGLQSTAQRILEPKPVDLSFRVATSTQALPGIALTVGTESQSTPFTTRVIANAMTQISAPESFVYDGRLYEFESWSDGGARTHTVHPNATTTYEARYERL